MLDNILAARSRVLLDGPSKVAVVVASDRRRLLAGSDVVVAEVPMPPAWVTAVSMSPRDRLPERRGRARRERPGGKR